MIKINNYEFYILYFHFEYGWKFELAIIRVCKGLDEWDLFSFYYTYCFVFIRFFGKEFALYRKEKK